MSKTEQKNIDPPVFSTRRTGKEATISAFFQFDVDESLPFEALDHFVKDALVAFEKKAQTLIPELVHFKIRMINTNSGQNIPFDQFPVVPE
jgi:hypothetical protein